jgi:pantoate kinase
LRGSKGVGVTIESYGKVEISITSKGQVDGPWKERRIIIIIIIIRN